MIIYPAKLKQGDHIRIVSPSSSIERIGGFDANLSAKDRLERLGFRVSFSKNYHANDLFYSAGIDERVADLHDAFADTSVQAILATIGGFNCNELLPYLDYELIRKNPKIICGYSDTTALLHAILTQAGVATYMGASYSSFKMNELQDYQSKAWLLAMTNHQYELVPSEQWSSDAWFLPNAQRTFYPTKWRVYTHGCASGRIIGGNLSTFALLNGTPYAPKVAQMDEGYVLFLEASEGYDRYDILRQMTAILQVYPNPNALLLGRFPKECQMSDEVLWFILDKYPQLKTIPVMTDLDFAHTQPLFTLTLGAMASIDTHRLSIKIHEC